MCIYVLFGLPGAGKSFVGKIFKDEFAFCFYEGDEELTEEMRHAIAVQALITEEMRSNFFKKITKRLKELKRKHKKIVLAQTFIKEKHRENLIKEIKDVQFILIQTNDDIREARLEARINYPLGKDYARKMCLNFDSPEIMHDVIVNNKEGEEDIKKQAQLILNKSFA
ncbi:hypothetical protein C4559_04390 [Candidatus Microgenomates bacterium]|nr:MAG: hypothetical protein C4559_04390 [Candidatus Microgenomates bacterium]